MTEPLESCTKFIYRESAAGAAVPGKVLADFAFVAAYKTQAGASVSWSHSSAIVDLGALLGAAWNGWYAWTYIMPPEEASCMIDPKVASGTDVLRPPMFSGEMEAKDLLSIFNAANKPVVSVAGEGTIGQITPLTLICKRYRIVTFTFTNEDGTPINMTLGVTYTNYVFGVRAKPDQTIIPPKVDQTTGIVAGNGFVTVTLLESASFFTILTEGAAAEDSYEARYELTADMVSPAGETVSLVQSSPLFIGRREVGT